MIGTENPALKITESNFISIMPKQSQNIKLYIVKSGYFFFRYLSVQKKNKLVLKLKNLIFAFLENYQNNRYIALIRQDIISSIVCIYLQPVHFNKLTNLFLCY